MATLTAWKFSEAGQAEEALTVLEGLQRQELIHVIDGAYVTWPADKKKPKTHQLHDTTAIGAMGGGFWGLLFGLIFFVPILGLAVGAAAGALAGSMRDVGISDDFITDVRSQVTPGTSALFLLTEGVVMDKVKDAFVNFDPHLISSNLTKEQEDKLKEFLSED